MSTDACDVFRSRPCLYTFEGAVVGGTLSPGAPSCAAPPSSARRAKFTLEEGRGAGRALLEGEGCDQRNFRAVAERSQGM